MVIMRRSPRTRWLQLIGYAALFVVGFGGGLLLSRAMETRAPSRIGQSDYVALVSVLYDRERSLSNARERLKALGSEDDAALVSSVAADYTPGVEGEPDDGEALRQLSLALNRGAAPEASPEATAAAQASTSRADGQPSGVDWTMVIVVAAMAGILVGLLLVIRYVLRPVPSTSFEREGAPSGRATAWSRSPARERPGARRSRPLFELPVFGAQKSRKPDEGGRSSQDTLAFSKPPAPRPADDLSARRSFISRYRLGDDPFDEVHPILDPNTGLLIGACGLSATLHGRSSEGRGYYAFLVWVHDYLTPQSFKGIGLTTRWRLREKSEDVTAWVESSIVDQIEAAETGLQTVIRTAHLDVEVSLPEVEYLPDAEGLPDGYFRTLVVKFDVASTPGELRDARADADPTLAVGTSDNGPEGE